MKLRRRLPGLSYTPKLRIEIRLTKSFAEVEEMEVRFFVKCISVVEEHSVVGLKQYRKELWTKQKRECWNK